jgi:polysaccharide deacetylase family protein (PEP-CTERM system associated)
VKHDRPKAVMTIDVEEYFHAENVMRSIGADAAARLSSRLDEPMKKILELLASSGNKATFFVLGRVAEKNAALIEAIRSAGHEVASHGYEHVPLHMHTPRTFEDDLKKSIAALSASGLERVKGYRATSFSLVKGMEWFYSALRDNGISYDSSTAASLFRAHYDEDLSRGPFLIRPDITEVPVSSGKLGPLTVPLGGGYFRILPYGIFSGMIRRIQASGGVPVLYFHPWEFDPGQPRFKLPAVKRLRHYANLAGAEKKLKRLLSEFSFITVEELLGLKNRC